MIIVVHSDYLGYILIRDLNHNTRFTMDFLVVQFHSTIKQNIFLILLLDKVCMLNAPMCHFIEQPKTINAKCNKGEEPPFNITTK